MSNELLTYRNPDKQNLELLVKASMKVLPLMKIQSHVLEASNITLIIIYHLLIL